MTPQLQCDILVIGAGPSGSSAALTAANEGLDVILVDSKARIGERPHCGEFVPYQLFRDFDLNRNSIVKQVDYLETWIVERNANIQFRKSAIQSKGYLIDRPRFDRNLAGQAAAAGVLTMSSTSFVDFKGSMTRINSVGKDLLVDAKFVVAADGAYSKVRKRMGMEANDCLVGCQLEVPLKQNISNAMVFLDKGFCGGYGWLFPKGLTANLGLGMFPGSNITPADALNNFSNMLTQNGLTRPGWLARTGGPIPYRGIRFPLIKNNVLFCGDAAGLTHPVTGAGISQAVHSGHLAGASVAKAVKSQNMSFVNEYHDTIMGLYGAVFSHALSKKTLLVKHWDDEDFKELCEKTWISFKGYKKRERNS
ncbi:MAG: NAD(P)/FAD-dependent oxidoreductase [Pseudomonadota bacterium]